MLLEVKQVDVWKAELEDRPGALAEKLAAVRRAGADLDFIIARRRYDKPGTGVVYLAKLEGEAQTEAAREAGLAIRQGPVVLHVQGQDEPGSAARLTRALADENINLRGLSGARIGRQCILYVGVESQAEADKAANVIRLL